MKMDCLNTFLGKKLAKEMGQEFKIDDTEQVVRIHDRYHYCVGLTFPVHVLMSSRITFKIPQLSINYRSSMSKKQKNKTYEHICCDPRQTCTKVFSKVYLVLFIRNRDSDIQQTHTVCKQLNDFFVYM